MMNTIVTMQISILLQNQIDNFSNVFNAKVLTFGYILQLKENSSYVQIVNNSEPQNIYLKTNAHKADPFVVPYEYTNSCYVFLDLNEHNLTAEFKSFLLLLQQSLNINFIFAVIEKTSSSIQTFLWGFAENLQEIKQATLNTYANAKEPLDLIFYKLKMQQFDLSRRKMFEFIYAWI